MPVQPLNASEIDQFALHVEELASDLIDPVNGQPFANEPAAQTANEMFDLYQSLAANVVGTVFNVELAGGPTLSVPEKNVVMAVCNELTIYEQTPGFPDPLSSGVANEMLGLYEERARGYATTGRDVTLPQMPR